MPTKEEKAAKRERLATAKAAIDQAKAATRSANALSVTQTENQQSVASNKLLAAGCVRKAKIFKAEAKNEARYQHTRAKATMAESKKNDYSVFELQAKLAEIDEQERTRRAKIQHIEQKLDAEVLLKEAKRVLAAARKDKKKRPTVDASMSKADKKASLRLHKSLSAAAVASAQNNIDLAAMLLTQAVARVKLTGFDQSEGDELTSLLLEPPPTVDPQFPKALVALMKEDGAMTVRIVRGQSVAFHSAEHGGSSPPSPMPQSPMQLSPMSLSASMSSRANSSSMLIPAQPRPAHTLATQPSKSSLHSTASTVSSTTSSKDKGEGCCSSCGSCCSSCYSRCGGFFAVCFTVTVVAFGTGCAEEFFGCPGPQEICIDMITGGAWGTLTACGKVAGHCAAGDPCRGLGVTVGHLARHGTGSSGS